MFDILKGWFGEKMTTFNMWLYMDETVYRRINNLIVPSRNGTTQIDHVLVSVFGIFVIETKNISGWIFGSPNQDKWTQVLYGKKYHFQNPLRQNYRHTKCLSEFLHLPHDLFRSVVFFIGDCEFKTEMPENVMERGFVTYIESFTKRCLADDQVQKIEDVLRKLKDNPVCDKYDHLRSLEERHNSTTQCPRCGAALVRRTARQGRFAGQEFLGCAKYPQCKYTRNL
ncbi:MAG: NERD domain-containing protein [Candidatus Brocadiia bacterium]